MNPRTLMICTHALVALCVAAATWTACAMTFATELRAGPAVAVVRPFGESLGERPGAASHGSKS